MGRAIPPLTHRALTAELDIGLLLPCNVVVYAADEAGKSVVAAMDPISTLELTGKERMRSVPQKVRTRLEQVLAAVRR